jgi:glycine/D-amino acid oxidase-like deaminating enzyme/nitrite reductase/ring-hydroxylating ferredoxin subunit
MVSESGHTVSPWVSTVEMPPTTALNQEIAVDVCVIGAGISGLSAAYLLGRRGKKVAVLDDGPIGGGETGRTTAHIVNALDDRYYELERLHGTRGAQLAAESHSAAIDQVEEIVATEKIDCEFTRLDGYLFEPKGGDPKDLERERDACLRAGLKVELVTRAPAPFDTGPALRFPKQAQFHPLKYLRGLALAIQRQGGQIFTGTFAEEIRGGESCQVKSKTGRTVRAGAVVVATNTPVNDRVVIHSKQMPYRTYVIGVEIPKDAIEPILLWDDDMPYHYVRLMRAPEGGRSDLLIVGGEDHKTGQHEEMSAPFGRLERWTRERYPMVGAVQFRWSGQVMEPVDAMGYIGRNPLDEENVYIITGDSGNGITHGTIGGILCTDLIMGRDNSWATLYDPRRKNLHPSASLEYTKENLNVVAQYRDYVTRGDVSSVDEIKNGAGAVVRRGLKHVAAFRDAQGVLHERSAVCPHLGCIVRWNHVEKSWDCPCHGSRFDPMGKVLNGPSLGDLNEAS